MTQVRQFQVGIAGATGMVGREFLDLLARRNFPVADLRLFASARSAGRHVPWCGKSPVVEDLATADIADLDILFFSAGGAIARAEAPRFAAAGVTVIDNSSAFREDPSVPLIVPEVNGETLSSEARLIANPNCSTIIMLLPLAVLHRHFGLNEVIVSTYQAVSGAGKAAMDDLTGQARAFVTGEAEPCDFYDQPIFMNLIPRIGDWTAEGDCIEERKMRIETWRILGDNSFPIHATTVRVPVERCHSESVFVRLRQGTSREAVAALFASAPGIELHDLPTPRELARREAVFVGRIRVDQADPTIVQFWVVSDQLWKGASLNAIQIAEQMIAKNLISPKRR
jgi:aspartate-semialdehyde dehydrogenase